MPACGSRIKDIEAKYYVALRFSVHRDLGTIIAANPSTILAIARLGDREKETLIRDFADGTIDRKWDIPAEIRAAARLSGRDQARRPRPGGSRRSSTGPAGCCPRTTGRTSSSWPTGPAARWGPISAATPSIFGDRPVRDVGLIASEGRMTIPIEDGTPAGILDIRHHYFEFIPEDQADRDEPETVEAADLIEGRQLLHPADDRGRALSLPNPRPGPLRRLPRPGPRDRVPQQGGPHLQPHRREALGVSRSSPRSRRPSASSGSG